MKYIAYYRVSTDKQNRSGLGLEAQRNIVQSYANSTGGTIAQEFTEVASGTKNNRKGIGDALLMCELTGATLLIAKLDRLSRNANFLTALADSKVKFVCCDMPNADKLTLHILAGVAEKEAKLISERTKLALMEAKKRGVKLGNRTNLHLVRNTDTSIMLAKRQANAEDYKIKMLKIIAETIPEYKTMTTRQLAKALNDKGIRSPKGSVITAMTVSRLLKK